MRKTTVEKGEIVIRDSGVTIHYSLDIVRKRIQKLCDDLDTWQSYERLLTRDAADGWTCPRCDCYAVGDDRCEWCGDPKPAVAGDCPAGTGWASRPEYLDRVD